MAIVTQIEAYLRELVQVKSITQFCTTIFEEDLSKANASSDGSVTGRLSASQNGDNGPWHRHLEAGAFGKIIDDFLKMFEASTKEYKNESLWNAYLRQKDKLKESIERIKRECRDESSYWHLDWDSFIDEAEDLQEILAKIVGDRCVLRQLLGGTYLIDKTMNQVTEDSEWE